MKLTNTQRRALTTYQRFHSKQPTMTSLLASVWLRYLLMVILAAIAVLILPMALGFLLAGFILGIIARDIQRYRDLAQLWPMYEAILARDEIEALLADER